MSVSNDWPSSVTSDDEPNQYLPPIYEQKPLTAAELVELAAAPRAGLFGRLEAILRTRFQQQMNETIEIAKQRSLIAEMQRQVREAGPTEDVEPEEFNNPTKNASPRIIPGSKGDPDTEGLRPSDMAWLALVAQRDPADLDEASVRHLARLEESAKHHSGAGFGSSDHFLAQEVMRPVRRHYDLAEAQHELERLQSTDESHFQMGGIDMEKAVSDAIRKETPQLSDGEAFNRALDVIQSARSGRLDSYDDRVAELRARITELRK